MKIEVGTKLTIKKDLRENYLGRLSVNDEMEKLAGQEIQVVSIDCEGDLKIDVDGNKWWWSPNMFEEFTSWIKNVLEKHQKWLRDDKGGERANLRGANLRGANLRDANLSDAKELDNARYNEKTCFLALQCPEKGLFIGFKKAENENNDEVIVELEIANDAKRSSATNRKCRCSKAKVISITDPEGLNTFEEAFSNFDSDFKYIVGEMVEVTNFDENRWDACSTGIHFFITRQEAVLY